MKKYKYIAILSVLALFSVVIFANAADIKILPSSGSFGVDKKFTVEIKIDTSGDSINAAQAKLEFDPDILKVESISKDGSIFNFWLLEPKFSNNDGTVEFIGGTPNGVSGGSLKVLSIVFSGKSLGSSDISFLNNAITKSDGSGDNIFGNATGAKFIISSGGGGSSSAQTSVIVQEPVPTPVPITRTSVKVSGLPDLPQINIPLYPDPNRWYGLVSNFNARWDLPSDVSAVSTALNQNANFDAPQKDEGLFEDKTFPALISDGVYYLHVRFKNNVGWGPTTHYRVAIDTQPPLPFNLDVLSGLKSDDPSPTLMFKTGDSLSGIGSLMINVNSEDPIVLGPEESDSQKDIQTVKILPTGFDFLNVRSEPSLSSEVIAKAVPGDIYKYTDKNSGWHKIKIDEKEGWITSQYAQENGEGALSQIFSISEYTLKPHPPGVYNIRVMALDMAGNGIEARTVVEITPIDPPAITFITQKVINGIGSPLKIQGTAIADSAVVLTIENKKGALILRDEALVNSEGGWEFILDRELSTGDYLVSAITRDLRGAISDPIEKIAISVRDKPLLSIAGIDITFKNLVWILIVAIIAIVAFYWKKISTHVFKTKRASVFIGKDLSSMLELIKKELDNISLITKKDINPENKNIEYLESIKKVSNSIDKIDRYVKKDIENLE